MTVGDLDHVCEGRPLNHMYDRAYAPSSQPLGRKIATQADDLVQADHLRLLT